MGELPTETLYKVCADLMACEVQGEFVILDPRSGKYFGLNAVASCVWRMLEHGASLPQLVETTVAEFDVLPETCESDLLGLIDELMSLDLVASHSQPRQTE